MNLLAQASDAAAQGYGLRDMFQALQALGLLWVGWKQQKFSKLEDRVEAKADEAVRARIDAMTAGLQVSIDGLARQVQQITQRLERGEDEFRSLNQEDHAVEVKLMREMRAFSEFVRDNCASKEDLKNLSARFDGLQRAVAQALVGRREAGTQ